MPNSRIFYIPVGLLALAGVLLIFLPFFLPGPDFEKQSSMVRGNAATQELAAVPASADRAASPGASFAPTARLKQSPSSAPSRQETAAMDRKLRETHRFSFKAQRNEIAAHYQRTTEACAVTWCTMLNGTISTQGASHHANIAVRIEPNMMDRFMAAVRDGNGSLELLEHNRSAQDMTAEFQDLSARRESQKALRDRLLALTKRPLPNDISDLLEIERELARVQGRIESMDARLRTINTVTDRTTVHVSFRSDALERPVSHPPYIQNALKEVSSIMSRNTAHLVKTTAALVPYLLPVALLGGLGVWIHRRRRRRSATTA